MIIGGEGGGGGGGEKCVLEFEIRGYIWFSKYKRG